MKHAYCVACGSKEHLTQHHLVPRSIGGSDEDSNLITLCGSCHAKAHGHNAAWRTSELTRKALQFKKAQGERVGAIPYGHDLADDGVRLLDNAEEQAVIQQARELKAGGASLRKIATELEDRGHYARNGARFQPAQIQRMIFFNPLPTTRDPNSINPAKVGFFSPPPKPHPSPQ